ncbi:hypothetical protein EDB81DRAFT_468265 [Dactylonectria macrodidyma]|uniref:Kinetoplast-associated protein KAP n=1 Tax=Dactylonectria macrodidyma TaxID=307937 RepID=A0A9P9EZT8_9HYPO|nr:hypothetical protein EDB81DRAFT_468265 [Dactylonectria macrodidyma]
MASPLSPTTNSTLNIQTPPTTRRYDAYEVRAVSSQSETGSETSQGSSPFVSAINETVVSEKENGSPSKSRHSRVLSGATLSPFKIITDQMESIESRASEKLASLSRTPRKKSPEKRFPIKVSNPIEAPRSPQGRTMSMEDVVRQSSGLKRAIEIFEDDQSDIEDEHDITTGTVNITRPAPAEVDESMCPDDTMISTFSTFSAIPDMTMFAKLGQSPDKMSNYGGMTPRAGGNTNLSPSRTARPMSMHESGNTTNLLDFTESMRFPQKTPSRNGNPSPLRIGTNVSATPSRQLTNLIDFDIPPMPTPRSVPSITPRELESLKSNFLSEISSLKASLSGKEAEALSLKAAVGDAEKRVGESMEQLREERALREQVTEEKEGWESRGREMESVLRKVKEEIVHSQREREELEQKLEESEKRREAAEMMHQEAESKMAGMRAGKEMERSPERAKNPGASSHEVEIAVERVARELHALYKGKHEAKVTALKKSYESRWEKRVRELEGRIEELGEENDHLRMGRDATMTKVDPNSAETEELKSKMVRDSAAMKELNADIQRLEAVVQTVQLDNEELRGLLERERVEKGELVQLAEEMMNMQSIVQPTPAKPQMPQMPHERQSEAKTPKRTMEQLRSSTRGSGLRAPGSSLRAPHERTKSAGGLPRPGGVPRSGIMSSIEKMGNYRGRGAE